jgi:TM2 domain-containing membrane protein YozV
VAEDNKKVLAGVTGILLGGLGVHRFVLGDTTGGLIRIGISVLTCGAGSFVGLIEGVIYLTKSDADFYQIYQVDKKKWF